MLDGAILQPFGIVAGKDELHRAEKPLVELRLLVGKILADAVTNGHATVLQLDHADRDAVHIKHQVGAPLVVALKRDFLGDGEIVFFRVNPVNQPNINSILAHHLHRHAIAQQAVDSLVIVVQAAVRVVGISAQPVERAADLRRAVAALAQVGR